MRLIKEALLQEVRNRSVVEIEPTLSVFALQFDGIDNWVEVPQSQFLIDNIDGFDHDIIVEASTAYPTGVRSTLWSTGTYEVNDIAFYGQFDNLGVRTYMRSGGAHVVGYFLTDKPDIIKSEFRGSNHLIYVNDAYKIGLTNTNRTNSKLRIGGYFDRKVDAPNFFFFNGRIYDFKIIQQPTGVVLLDYDFTTGSGNTLFDKSGNNNHGTIYGAQWVEI